LKAVRTTGAPNWPSFQQVLRLLQICIHADRQAGQHDLADPGIEITGAFGLGRGGAGAARRGAPVVLASCATDAAVTSSKGGGVKYRA
jgi:hypothetical protein